MSAHLDQIDIQKLKAASRNVLIIPSEFKPVLGIPIDIHLAIEYLAIIAFPASSARKKRQEFIDATQIAILRDARYPKHFIKEHTSGKEWQRVESCLRKGRRRIAKSLIYWQCYKEYQLYMEQQEHGCRNWDDFIIRSMAFYQKHADGFGFVKGNKIDYQQEWEERFNPLNEFPDTHEQLRANHADWAAIRPVYHLIDGLMRSYRDVGITEVPHYRASVLNPFWVVDAINYSNACLIEILNTNENSHPRRKKGIKLKIEEMLIVELSMTGAF